jgi:hypothetical protein
MPLRTLAMAGLASARTSRAAPRCTLALRSTRGRIAAGWAAARCMLCTPAFLVAQIDILLIARALRADERPGARGLVLGGGVEDSGEWKASAYVLRDYGVVRYIRAGGA